MAVYPRRVKKGSDGVYRWSYDEPLTYKNPMFARSLVFGAVIGAVVCAAILIVNKEWLVQALLAFACIACVPLVVWTVNIKVLHMHIHGEYAMGNEYIDVRGSSNKERHEFAKIKRIVVDPRHDTIRIKDSILDVLVMVNEKDMDMVQEFLKGHVSDAKFETK